MSEDEEVSPPKRSRKAETEVHITSNKACQAFKTRATQLSKLIKETLPDCVIEVDEQKKLSSKPDKGSFVVKVGDVTLVELVAMPRPFTAMKALDIAELAEEVIGELKKKKEGKD
jgi:hypothetical protein